MSRFARDRRVYFVEEPVTDDGAAWMETREVAPNLVVATPHLPDGVDAEAEQRRLLDELLASQNVRRPLLWFYTPMALAFAGHVDAAGIVFDCMDELSAFHGAPPELRERERELLRRADVVFTGGQSLYESKRTQHGNVLAFPSSVEAAHFATARADGVTDPEDQASIPHPRLGYFGVVDERIDRDLLASLADAEPSFQIVMVGPVVKVDPESLPRRPNLHWLGQKTYAELPRYLAGWDVAIMPFALNESTRFISPTKTLEYLAAGKPVVSTAIRDVVRPYGERDLVRIADARTFPREVAAALAEASTAKATERRAAADGYVAGTSWDRTYEQMSAAIQKALAAPTLSSGERGSPSRSSSAPREERNNPTTDLGEVTCSTT